MIALLAILNIVANNSWYIDIGATHSITLYLSNLNNTSHFLGISKVLVGKALDISNISQFIIPF